MLSIKTAHALVALVVFFVSTLSAMSAERIALTNKESINAISLQRCMQHDVVKTTPCLHRQIKDKSLCIRYACLDDLRKDIKLSREEKQHRFCVVRKFPGSSSSC